MGSTRRTVLTTKHKAVLWFLGLLFLWEVLQSNAVLEAFLTFGFAGVVPGTNIVLSPDAVIMVTGIALALLFVIIVLAVLLRRPKDRVPANLERAAEALAAESTEATASQPADSTPPVVVSHHKPASAGLFARTSKKLQLLSNAIRRKAMRAIGISLEWIDVKLPIVARALHRISHVLWALGMIAFVFGRKWAIVALRFAKQQTAAFWRWLVPYLWKFDTWLELQVRAFTKWARYKSRQYHSLTVIISMFRQYKKLYSSSPIAAFFTSTKREASRSKDEV